MQSSLREEVHTSINGTGERDRMVSESEGEEGGGRREAEGEGAEGGGGGGGESRGEAGVEEAEGGDEHTRLWVRLLGAGGRSLVVFRGHCRPVAVVHCSQ